MSNERRGCRVTAIAALVIAIWATTALLAIATRVLHVVVSVVVWSAVAALVALFLRPSRRPSRSFEEDR